MGRRGDPPDEGPSEGPPGGEDEYGSVVFDESFVSAARVQEYSAVERMGDHARAVRSLPARGRRGPRRILLLVLLLVLAFGTAVYLGVRRPYQPAASRPGDTLRMTLVPLAPRGTVPGGTPEQVFEDGPAAGYRAGAAGIALPAVRRTDHFTEDQVTTALATVKDYLVASSVDPDVLTGGEARAVRALLHPDQLDQFDRSMAAPAADGRHAATGWLVRFDPAEVELAAGEVRVSGALLVTERDAGWLEVTSDHTFAYALRPPAAGPAEERASLYTVRRELRFRLDRDDLRQHRLTVLTSSAQAGPQDCAEETAAVLHPLLAGRRATSAGPADTDPYAPGPARAALCGALAGRSLPSPAGP